MKKQKKKRKGFQAGSMRCPYCGSPVIYRSADGIYHDNSKKTICAMNWLSKHRDD